MGWDRQWCMHGKREGLDSHDCPECRAMAQEMGKDCSHGETWLFASVPASLAAQREKAALEEASGAVSSISEPMRI